VPGARDDGELPGEAAALAAFRAARARSGPGARPVRRTRLRSPLGRPLRVGIAAVTLGGVLGGVAVAAGTGVLPAPFGRGNDSPTPASSVTAAPDGRLRQPSGTIGSPSAGHGPGTGRDGEARGGPAAPGEGDPANAGPGDRPEGGSSGAADGTYGSSGVADGTDGDRSEDPAVRTPREEARLRALCEEFLADGLGRDGRAELERAADGPGGVDGFCRRYTAADGGAGGGTGDGTPLGGSPSGGNPSGGGSSGTGGSAGPTTGGPSTGGQDGIEGGDTLPDEGGDGIEGGDTLPDEGGDGAEDGDTLPAGTRPTAPTAPTAPATPGRPSTAAVTAS
jgi:hypothetical protein